MRRNGTSRRRHTPLLLLPILVLVFPACGTRLPDSAFVKGGRGSASGTGISQGEGNADQLASEGKAGDAGTAGSVSGGTATGGAPAAAGQSGAGANGGSGPGGPNTASDVGVTPTAIKLGNVTSIQGQFGPDAFSPSLYGLQAYVAGINARGG